MIRQVVKELIAAIYTLAVTIAIGRWSVYIAYIERGYMAFGGEYFLIIIICWIAWKSINYLFNTMEDFKYERSKERRSGKTS